METITFNCRFITPAFLGGAAPKGTPELRPPSVKGALRFWWRAQCGISDVNKLHERESEIFGGVEGEKAKKASFSIRAQYDDFELVEKLPRCDVMVKSKGRTFPVNIFEYLAYGTFDYVKGQGNVLNRHFIKPGQVFRVVFAFNKPEFEGEVCRAFRLLALFGGLGNRSRNGYGSFCIEHDTTPMNWRSTLESLKAGDEKGFNSFSKNLACFETAETFTKLNDAWAELGKSYKNAREYVDDKHSSTHRSYVSSPIIEDKKQTTFLDRHTKPYFFSIVPENGEYRGVIVYLPYLFLEGGDEMLKALFKDKEKNIRGMAMTINKLRTSLIQTSIPKHQEYFTESNGFFQRELMHQDNPYRLIQAL